MLDKLSVSPSPNSREPVAPASQAPVDNEPEPSPDEWRFRLPYATMALALLVPAAFFWLAAALYVAGAPGAFTAMTHGVPVWLTVVFVAAAPFVAGVLAAVALRWPRGRGVATVALVASFLALGALVFWLAVEVARG